MQYKTSIAFLLICTLIFTSCNSKKTESKTVSTPINLLEILSRDTLRIATMYGSTSYFLFRDELMGFDYEMAGYLANNLNVNLDVKIAKTESEMTKMLEEGTVDVIAYNMIETKNLKKNFDFVFPQNESYQVLVQNIGSNAISDVTALAGKNVYVPANSIFLKRLNALNDEIGGSINIVIAADSLTDDDLIDMVAEKKIDFTVAYHNVAILHRAYYKNLDCRTAIGFKQKNGWLIRSDSKELKKYIDNWSSLPETELNQSKLISKYWEKSPFFAIRKIKIPKGAISPYDGYFKKYAPIINWDWRLLASLAFHESRFDASEVSWVGASGLMQLMPRTAANFGLDEVTVFNPELNIEASVQYIKSLNFYFREIKNTEERTKFILAAYNSGPAHILDAMALAEKYGKNPHIWFNEVEFFLLKKSEPEFYNDPVVKYGIFRGKETVRYVHNTLDTYAKYLARK